MRLARPHPRPLKTALYVSWRIGMLFGSAGIAVALLENGAMLNFSFRPIRSAISWALIPAGLALLIGGPALASHPGREFYLDCAGSDSSSGTSPISPWKSVARLNAERLLPGDTAYLKRGCLWRETLMPNGDGAQGLPITITAYGDGDPPTIDGADPVTGWKRVPSSNVLFMAPLGRKPANVYVDDAGGWGLDEASSLGALSPGSWFWEPGTLYVKLADGRSPEAHRVEAVTRPRGVFVQDHGHIVVDHLRTIRTGCWGIEMLARAPERNIGSVISDNIVLQNGTNLVDKGDYCNAIYINYAISPVVAHNIVSYAGGHNAVNVQNARHIRILDNDVSQWNHNGLDTKMSIDVVYRGNRAHDAPGGNGIYSEASSDIIADHNVIYNIGGRINGGSNGVHIDYRTGGRVIIAHNSIYNTFGGIYLLCPASAKANAISTRSGIALTAPADGDYDYNILGSNGRIEIGRRIISFEQWRRMTNHSHDLAVDPMFTAPSKGDFAPLPGSPCVGVASDLALPIDGQSRDAGAVNSRPRN